MDRGLSQCLGLLELLFHGGSWESQLDRVVRDSHVGATTTTDIQRSFRWLVGGWLEPFFFYNEITPKFTMYSRWWFQNMSYVHPYVGN